MTREQIEKEAIKFAKSHYLDKYGNMNAEITEDELDALVCSIAYMFMYGAQWCINSVWYDSSSAYIPKKRAIVVLKNGVSNIYKDLSVITRKGMWNDVEMFAYIDDLLPERKEETE